MLIGLGQLFMMLYSFPMSREEYQKLFEENERLKNEIQGLYDLVSLLRRKQFGKSSEQIPSEQMGMFDEVEVEFLNTEPEDEESIKIPEHEHKRGKRLKLPDNLPRKEVIIDIEDKICPNDSEELKCIGEEVTEKLEIIPAKVRVIRTIRKKYACSACELMKEAPAFFYRVEMMRLNSFTISVAKKGVRFHSIIQST